MVQGRVPDDKRQVDRCNTIADVGTNAMKVFRAQGCLLGQLAGDALGSLVEFQTPEQIRRE